MKEYAPGTARLPARESGQDVRRVPQATEQERTPACPKRTALTSRPRLNTPRNFHPAMLTADFPGDGGNEQDPGRWCQPSPSDFVPARAIQGLSTRLGVFPAEQGKNREILSFFSGSLGFRRSLRPKFKHLLPVSLSLGAGKYMTPNREFSSAIRESWNWFFEGSSPEIQFRSM